MKSTKLPSWIERLLGLDPVWPPPHVFALERHELRYGGFHHSPQGWVFETSRREPLPEDLFADGVLGAPMREPRAFWEILQDFVAALPGPIKEASLILPDGWLRLTFTESDELARSRKARDEILRWKLKRLVPFRVEELRVSATEVRAFPNQTEPLRLLIGFAIESLVAQLEDAFQGVGIELGQITNNTLALAAGLESILAPDELAALVLVEREAYTLSYLYGGEPLLYRYKAFGDETLPEAGAGNADSTATAAAGARDESSSEQSTAADGIFVGDSPASGVSAGDSPAGGIPAGGIPEGGIPEGGIPEGDSPEGGASENGDFWSGPGSAVTMFRDPLYPAVDSGAVRRNLRLTMSFVRRHFPERPLARLFLAAPPEAEMQWLDWLAEELEVAPEPLGFEHFALTRTQTGESWAVTGPLLGAASIEVT